MACKDDARQTLHMIEFLPTVIQHLEVETQTVTQYLGVEVLQARINPWVPTQLHLLSASDVNSYFTSSESQSSYLAAWSSPAMPGFGISALTWMYIPSPV